MKHENRRMLFIKSVAGLIAWILEDTKSERKRLGEETIFRLSESDSMEMEIVGLCSFA
ncbi:MAG: hypothetical protein ACI837_002224 [Crocinitomicaceae bacterium]|jgi:hypothetical protein